MESADHIHNLAVTRRSHSSAPRKAQRFTRRRPLGPWDRTSTAQTQKCTNPQMHKPTNAQTHSGTRSPRHRSGSRDSRQGKGTGAGTAALTWSSFPSAGVTSATLANSPSRMMGSTLSGMTLMMAFCAAARSDSTAAASASPVWPSAACRVAMSSQGQRTASCTWGPALMLPAAGSGRSYRSARRPERGGSAPAPAPLRLRLRTEPGAAAGLGHRQLGSPGLAIAAAPALRHVLRGRRQLTGIF